MGRPAVGSVGDLSGKEVEMTEHPRVEGARASIDAFNRGDMATLRDFYAEDVV